MYFYQNYTNAHTHTHCKCISKIALVNNLTARRQKTYLCTQIRPPLLREEKLFFSRVDTFDWEGFHFCSVRFCVCLKVYFFQILFCSLNSEGNKIRIGDVARFDFAVRLLHLYCEVLSL